MILHTSNEGAVRLRRTRVLLGTYSTAPWGVLRTILLLLLLTVGVNGAWGQTPKVADGIYYIQNNATNQGYLWPSITTNADTGYRYLTTSLATSAEAVVNNNGVSYPAHDKSYSHWVVKNVTGGYIQLINPRLNKYVVIRNKTYGDRDVWLVDEPAAEDIDYTYFELNNASSPYKISPKAGLNNVANTSGYSLNSASGNDRVWLTWSKSDNKPQKEEGREGLIQCYSGGTPTWLFTSDLLDAPTISNVDANNIVTVADANGLPSGYNIRYTIDSTVPTASSPIMIGNTFTVTSQVTMKAVVERYGIVLTDVSTKDLAPAPCATPVITYDYTTSMASITCATPSSTIYYTIDGSTPTTSSSLYSNPFSVTSPTTLKAFATHATRVSSAVAELAITQVATPTIQNNGSNAVSIKTTTPGATIYYTTDGSTPTITSSKYIEPLTDNISNVTIKAIAMKEDMITSEVGSGQVKLQCATPVIKRVDTTFTLSCNMPTDANLYYTLGSGSETLYSEPVTFTSDQLPITVTAVARHSDYTQSETTSMELKSGSGTPEDPYLIYGGTDFTNFVTNVNDGTTASASYKLGSDVSASGFTTIANTFSGTLEAAINPETQMPYRITGLDAPLFTTLTGTVKNLVLEEVGISGNSGNTGAIACTAEGAARIYNVGILSGEVGGTTNTGGLVGFLDGTARVINCYSFADITSGTEKGGIVGYNNVASSQSNVATMVMNCMFYGTIASGDNVSPIFGGQNIDNKNSGGLATYNYYLYRTDLTITDNKYNCALAVEEKFLNRFEIFRQLENSNKKLASIYATGSAADADSKMLKWVLETADRTVSDPKPYPVLKAQGYYPSIINYDADNAPDSTSVGRNHGGKLAKTLSVTISGVGSNAPTGASITTGSLSLQRTDKDFDRFNFNYDKVQLPYYNDVGTGNYTGNRVVTGWKITSITGGTAGTYSASDEFGGYNFADRNCTNKDLYSVSGRVFSQGAYFEVPYGVTGITIEPYWGVAAYVSDQYYDVVYKENGDNNYSGQNVNVASAGLGTQTSNGADVDINGSIQKVYTSINNARTAMSIPTSTTSGKTVYDYAVVLVGNVHQAGTLSGDYTPYTITSIDLDKDNEPDYSFIFSHHKRQNVSPIRFDFLNVVGTAQAQKPNGTSRMLNVSIFKPKGWFEVTNTCNIYFVQFEGDNGSKTSAPIILLGGVVDQFTSTQNQKVTTSTQYIHLGSNAWFKAFGNGTHSDGWSFTSHVPVSVTGGDFEGFYLSGVYRPDAGIEQDNAECYISSGRFNEVAGAAQQMIDGDVHWQIYNADITNFYGGGINAAKPVTGDITVDITNSYVETYCGGPKFGDMQKSGTTFTTKYSTNQAGSSTRTYSRAITKDGKVTTNATGCEFNKFFGAGYGGTSYSELKFHDDTSYDFSTLTSNYTNDRGKYFNGQNTSSNYGNKGPGVATDFSYEFFVWSSGQVGARFYVKYASFSLAQCNDVESKLKNCLVNTNFYGGGSIGKVDGTATSELENCTVLGSVFAGGYSASLPTIPVRSGGFTTVPKFNNQSGMFEPGVLSATTDFDWTSGTLTENTTAINESDGKHDIFTNVDLTTLGEVAHTDLTIKGTTTVAGSVYGGGEESAVGGATEVNVVSGTISTDVFGGGKEGNVGGSVTVNMNGGTVTGSLYGGGALANTNTGNWDATNNTWAAGKYDGSTTYRTDVNLTGGTVEGDVYGGGLGRLAQPALTAVEAKVYGDILVKLNETVASDNCVVQGSIFGCNNLNGSPQSAVTVHIYKTHGDTRTAQEELDDESATHTYHLAAVYGGGNLSAFYPDLEATRNTVQARVIIDGCDLTSIKQVYGGGNAASTPATNVTINGAYEIDEVFGGGNGLSDVTKNGVTYPNPGANVGYLDYSEYYEEGGVWKVRDKADADTKEHRIENYNYGSGQASVNIYGGRIHSVFGGSNTKGNVRSTAVTILDNEDNPCLLNIDEAYGGGKSAPMDAEAKLLMSCIPGLKTAYGGAQDADIQGNVTLNITNGTFDRVFGGNNESGTINGSITVNIEETGCRPIIIGELYGGGNQAAYSVYGYNDDKTPKESGTPLHDNPVVNVKSFTSIGTIYGGGYGSGAVMYGSPTVNISVAEGKYKDTAYDGVTKEIDGHSVIIPNHAAGKIGAIQNIFGGGNAAKVQGNTNVNIGTLSKVYVTLPDIPEGTTLGTGDYTDVYTRSTDGTYSAATGSSTAGTTYYKELSVVGADIRGNVYGGGNAAEVTGDTNVVIGKKSTE